jgi:hypothetical protein
MLQEERRDGIALLEGLTHAPSFANADALAPFI